MKTPILLLLAAAAALGVSSASAQTYTSPAASGTENWSTGSNWTGGIAPVSGLDTELIFGGTLNASAAIVSNNDVASPPFQLNKLTFNASGTTTAGTYLISGSQLDFRNNTGATGPTMVFSGGTTAPALTISNNILLANDLAITATTSGILSGVITGAGRNLTISGGGTVQLNNAGNTFGGVGNTITVSGNSILRTSNNSPVGAFGSASNKIILNGGRLSHNPAGGNSAAIPQAIEFQSAGTNTIIIGGGSGGRNTVLGGALTGSAGFTTSFSNTATVLGITNNTGANDSLTGTVTVAGPSSAAGIYVTADATRDALGGANLNINSGQFLFGGTSGSAVTLANFSRSIAVTTAGGVSASNNYTFTHTGALTGSATLSLNSATNALTGFNLSGANSVIVLNGDMSAFTGGLTLSNGTLRFGSSGTMPTTRFGALTLANTAGVNADLNGRSVTVGGLATGGATGGNIQGNSTGSANTLTIDTTTAGQSYAGIISNGGSVALNVTKTGINTQTLSGANTYTGDTTLSGGTLTLGAGGATGSIASSTIVYNGGALGFNRSDAITQSTSGLYANAGSAITGTGGVTQNGTAASSVTLDLANTYTGATTVTGGVLRAGIASVAGVSGAFGNNSAVTTGTTAGVSIDLNGFNTQVGSLAGGNATAGGITLGSNTLTIGGASGSTSYAGVISGAGNITKTGGGSQALTGANTYNGTTDINAGTLSIGNAATFTNTSAINLTGTGRLDVNVANQSLAKLNTGSSGVVAAGTFLRYSQNQATAGASNGPGTILGTVELNAGTVSPNYALNFGTGSTLTNVISGNYGGAITLSGNSTFDAAASTLTVSGGVTSTGGAKVLTLTGAGNGALSASQNPISGGSGTIGVIKEGAGTWTISNTNNTLQPTFAISDATINQGTLFFSAAANPANITTTNVGSISLGRTGSNSDSATFRFNVTNASFQAPITVNAGSNGTLTIARASGSGTGAITGGITLNNNVTLDGGASTLSISTTGISGTGNVTTTGSVTFGVANTFGGSVNASTGTLTLSVANALNAAGTNPLTISSGAAATLTTTGAALGGSGNTVAVNGTLNLNNTANSNYGGGQITLNNGGLINIGDGQSITYTTAKIVVASGATAAINRTGNVFANAFVTSVAVNGLDIGQSGTGATVNHTIGTGGGAVRLAITGDTTLYGNSTINANQTEAPDTVHYVKGIGQSGGTYGLTKGGVGNLLLGSTGFASTYGGTTTVSAGTLSIGVADSLPDTALAVNTGAAFVMSAITPANATYNQRVLGLNDGTGGGGTITGNKINVANTGSVQNRTLTLDGTSGSYAFSGVIEDKPVANVTATSTLALTKTGNSTQTLSGVNTYTGATTVSGGSLFVNGSLGATAVTVGTGATLGGSGSIAGLTTVQSGGTLAPGNSPGIETFSAGLILETGSDFSFELNSDTAALVDRGVATGFDGVNVTGGTFNLQTGVNFNIKLDGSGSTTDFSSTFWDTDQSWLVFDNANSPSIAGSFTLGSVSLDSNGAAFSSTGGSFSFGQTDNDIYLNYVIPEPSTIALVAVSLLAAGLLRKRRRN